MLPLRKIVYFLLAPLNLFAAVIPSTEEDVANYLQQAQEELLTSIGSLSAAPDLLIWNRLSGQILTHFSLLTYLAQSDLPAKESASLAILQLHGLLFRSLIQNQQLYDAWLVYAEDHPSLDPYYARQLRVLLESGLLMEGLTDEMKDRLEAAIATYAGHEEALFLSLQSGTPDKSAQTEELTVLTLNCCFMPGPFPFLYGGAPLPWPERVNGLATRIIESGVDVICLQEVHEEDTSYALYQALQNDYSYFYTAMAPRTLGFSTATYGLPSGLFVASKYPIEKPRFNLFAISGFPMNYGFFDFVVKSNMGPMAHIYTTHMQSLNYTHFPQIRALQLKQILETMEADQQEESIPHFLCGDLNIPYGSEEPAELMLQEQFYDHFNQERRPVDADHRTCTDYFTGYLLSPTQIDPNFQILDYALLLKSERSSYAIETELFPMNDLDRPLEALSDHHGLLTTIHR